MTINDTTPLIEGFHHAFKIENIYQAPGCPGVYFFIHQTGDTFNVLYIGCSKWVRGRINNHPLKLKLKRLGINVDVWLIPLNERNYRSVEIIMIDYFRPKYNKRVVNVGMAYKLKSL